MKRFIKHILAACAHASRNCRRVASGLFTDALLVAGAAFVSYGAWLVYAPAGFICIGALLLVAGVLASMKAR